MSRETTTPDRWGRRTRWTLIKTATGEIPTGDAREAWEQLVERYRDPVKNAVVRLMRHHPAAEDVAEDFFAYLYSQKLLDRAEPKTGRFRCFIQGVIKRYVKSAARQEISRTIDITESEPAAAAPGASAEEREEAEWALSVLRNATRELVAAHPRDGRLLLEAFGIAPYPQVPRKQLCEREGLSSNALNVAIHRARQHLRALLMQEIRDTVDSDSDYQEESEVIAQRLCSARPDLFDSEDSFIEWAEE